MSLAPLVQPASAGAPRVRVMVVDDSVVIRGLVARWLDESGDFEVVATASNGRLAVEALARVEPDLVVLDIEMPEMDGMTALPLLLQRRPNLKVVVVSTLTQRNAEISLKCLSLGAADYVAKPSGNRQVTTSTTFRQELIEKLKAIAGSRARPARPALRLAPVPHKPTVRAGSSRPQCLLIGASTGGPRAIEEVLVGMGSVLQKSPCWWSSTCRRCSRACSPITCAFNSAYAPANRTMANCWCRALSISHPAVAIWGSPPG